MKSTSTGSQRSDELTITATREEWDAALRNGFSYSSWRVEGRAVTMLRDTVYDGYEDREADARREWEAKLPVLTDEVKAKLEEQVRHLVKEHAAGRLKVDHLGHPSPPEVGGYRVSCTPHLATSGSGLQFRFAKDLYFGHKLLSLRDHERQWFIDLVHEVTGQSDGHVWNGSGPYVNVQWWPSRMNLPRTSTP